MSYAVVRVQKMTMGSVRGIEIHDRRVKEGISHSNPDIDWLRTGDNYDLHPEQNKNFYRTVKSRIDSLALKRSVRKDAVVMAQVLVTSDKDFFDQLQSQGGDEAVRKFFQASYDFLADRYGEENIISSIVHLDERTPHMHFNFVPVTNDGRLCAKEVTARGQIVSLHDRFRETVGKHYDLLRGESKEAGKRRMHLETAEYKAVMEEVKREQERAVELREDNERMEAETAAQLQKLHRIKNEVENAKTEAQRIRSDAAAEVGQLLADAKTEAAGIVGTALDERNRAVQECDEARQERDELREDNERMEAETNAQFEGLKKSFFEEKNAMRQEIENAKAEAQQIRSDAVAEAKQLRADTESEAQKIQAAAKAEAAEIIGIAPQERSRAIQERNIATQEATEAVARVEDAKKEINALEGELRRLRGKQAEWRSSLRSEKQILAVGEEVKPLFGVGGAPYIKCKPDEFAELQKAASNNFAWKTRAEEAEGRLAKLEEKYADTERRLENAWDAKNSLADKLKDCQVELKKSQNQNKIFDTFIRKMKLVNDYQNWHDDMRRQQERTQSQREAEGMER